MLELDREYTLDELEQSLANAKPTCGEMRKKIYEAGIVCQALKILFAKDPPIVVIPDDRYEKAPDAQIISAGRRHRTGVEVVTFTRYSNSEGLTRFFGRTKLSPIMAYAPETMIVCDVQTPLVDPEKTCQKISSALHSWKQEITHDVYLYYHGNTDGPTLEKLIGAR